MATILQNQEQENENNGQQPGQLQTIGTAAPQTPASNAGPANVAKPQGSGRFTNLQKYLSANQGAGQRIAQQVGGNINKDLDKSQGQAQQYYQQLGQNIANANSTAQQGAAFQRQLQNMGQDIKSTQDAGFAQRDNANLSSLTNFTNQPDFSQFQNIQAGRGIDENLLALQQQRAYGQANQTAQAADAAKQQLANESGRFELLRQAFGGSTRPGYSQGQQRLDQVLLGQGGGLGGVQADVAAKARAAQQQAQLAGASSQDVARLSAQERGLIGDINTQAGANEQAYMNMLKSYIDPTNQQRQQEFDSLNESIASYKKPLQQATGSGFTQKQLQRLGAGNLGANTGVYNAFDSINDANAIASQGRQAASAQDVANQSDVDRYAALAKISGIMPTALNQVGDLGASYTAKEGDASLANRLTSSQKQFDDAIANKRLTSNSYFNNMTVGAKDLLDQGLNANIRTQYGQDFNSLGNYTNTLNANDKNALRNTNYNQLQDLLNQQNYARTLGGQRTSFLDTQRPNPKLSGLPITGSWEDPAVKKTSK